MSIDYYRMGKGDELIPLDDVHEGAKEFDKPSRVIAASTIDDSIKVSTVFLVFDHGFGMSESLPVVFETMIFGGEHDQFQRRYCLRSEALAGHASVVKALLNGKDPDDG